MVQLNFIRPIYHLAAVFGVDAHCKPVLLLLQFWVNVGVGRVEKVGEMSGNPVLGAVSISDSFNSVAILMSRCNGLAFVKVPNKAPFRSGFKT